MLFNDFKGAYVSLRRTKVKQVIQELKISRNIAKLIPLTLQEMLNIVRINGRIFMDFEVLSGLRHLSTELFSDVPVVVMRESIMNRAGAVFIKS